MAQEISSRLGQRIKQLRETGGLSQAQLAERLVDPVEPESVSRWERGARMPSWSRLAQIAQVLGTDLDGFLIGLVAHRGLPADRPELRACFDRLTGLTDAQLRAAIRVLDAHLDGMKVGHE